MNFTGRDKELRLLDDLNQRNGAQFLVLYGRRRIGKTRLVTHWSRGVDIPVLYWMATQTSATNQLRSLSQALFHFLNPGAAIEPTFSYSSWDALFAEVARAAAEQRLVLVLDEFTYVMQADSEVASLLQKAWDHRLKSSNVFLILTGSLAGIIQRAALDYQAPLYGRATARLKLQPLSFGALVDLLPGFSPEQRVGVYAIAGGVPAYIELFDDRLNILQNLRQRIVTPANVMLSDGVFLLHEQLSEPRNYAAIIEAIAAGFHRLSEVAMMAGIDRSNIGKYLSVLQELGYVERQVPATVRRPERSRKGRYVITDPYLRFYYRFLAPYRGAIEQGRIRQVTSLLHDHLLDFIGTHTFEELCRDWLAAAAEAGEAPLLPERIGSHWSREAQVDVVAVSWRSKEILFGECKWGKRPLERGVVRTLLDKSHKILPEGASWQVTYTFFARSGFTDPARALVAEHNGLLVDLPKIESDMRRWASTG